MGIELKTLRATSPGIRGVLAPRLFGMTDPRGLAMPGTAVRLAPGALRVLGCSASTLPLTPSREEGGQGTGVGD